MTEDGKIMKKATISDHPDPVGLLFTWITFAPGIVLFANRRHIGGNTPLLGPHNAVILLSKEHWKCNFHAILVNYDGPTNHPTDIRVTL